ncbi:MAG TPA: ATP-binding protein [Acidimicrobiia bacterium]
MDLSQLIEIATANVEPVRVEVGPLEPAHIVKEAVGGLTQLITELVDNAIAFSGPDEKVSVTGVFDRDAYSISISDNGIGIPETLLAALNRVLSDAGATGSESGASLGIVMVARLAARHGIDVSLVPSVPGTTARVTIPAALVSPGKVFETPPSERVVSDVAVEETPYRPGHVVAMSESARREAESFLEKVFGPLRGRTATRSPARSKSNGNGHIAAPAASPTQSSGPALQTRVPGANFAVTDDDPSVVSGEGAIDIRLNLTRYDEGRRQAADSDRPIEDEADG